MARETVRDKAGRYLLEGRVILNRVDARMVVARVRGDGAIYSTGWANGAWSCDCPHQARTDCSHVLALKRVTAIDLGADR
ncbi:hypothetical protein [Actinospongicola halichondriae]|uniref:hypothetical protein n=1 Tax=Actinospongicola halichondriae TaxID=3236844 RepID=UPI003D3D7F7B